MIENLFFQIIPFLLVITVLVTIHELGHYIAARFFGVAVHTFSVGFGRPLWKKINAKGVTWQICMIPLGGYVRLASLDLLEYKKEQGLLSEERFNELKPRTMEGQSTFARISVAFAGPLANILFAFILLFVFHSSVRPASQVLCVEPNSPAQMAGLQKNDIVDMETGSVFRNKEKQPINLNQIEKKEIQSFTCLKEEGAAKLLGQKAYGFIRETVIIRQNEGDFKTSLIKSTKDIQASALGFMGAISQIFVKSEEDLQVGGIMAIQQEIASVSRLSVWILIRFSAFLSLSLAYFNLLPIPVLDGGHIVIALIEGMTKKRLPQKIRTIILLFGLAFLIFLFMFVMKLDIINYIQG